MNGFLHSICCSQLVFWDDECHQRPEVCMCDVCMTDNSGILPIQHVDAIVARSFAQLAAVAVKKHALESDPLLVSE